MSAPAGAEKGSFHRDAGPWATILLRNAPKLPAMLSSRMIAGSRSRFLPPAIIEAGSDAYRLIPLRGKKQRNPNNIDRPSWTPHSPGLSRPWGDN